MSALATALNVAIIHALWQDAVIGVLLGLLLSTLRRRSSNIRYAVACIALAVMAIVPTLTMVATYQRVVEDVAVAPPIAHSAPRLLTYSDGGSRIWSDAAAADGGLLGVIQAWTLPLWLLGVLVFSLRLVSAATHVTTLRRRGAPADDAVAIAVRRLAASMRIDRPVNVFISAVTISPATIGWLRPIIIMPPATAMGLTPEQFEAVLAHELAHVRRHDYIVNLLQMVVETLFFYHPAVWWASGRIRVERELCCDDAAVSSCGNVVEYAQALIAIARCQNMNAAGVIRMSGGSLLDRIQHLLQPAVPPPPGPSWSAMLAVVLAIVSTIGAERWLHAQVVGRRAQPATLTLAVVDPFGQPAANVEVIFEQGPFQDGVVFGHGRTDEAGSYRIRLPAGTYVVTGTTEFFPPTTVTLTAGETVRRGIRMAATPVTSSFSICIDCADGNDPYIVPASIAEELARDRQAAATELVQEAEPVGGWEAFRLRAPASLRELDTAVQGIVIIEGRIQRDGRTAGLRVAEAAAPELAAAAVAALQNQRWEPARVRGVPLEVPLRLTLQYVREER